MKIVTGILIAVIIAFVVGFVPLKEVAYTVEETEPLSYEVEALVKKEQRDPRFILSSVAFSRDLAEIEAALQEAYMKIPVAYITVQNTDTISGVFAVLIAFSTPEHYYSNYTGNITLQLRPGELETVKYHAADIDADYDEWSWEYEVIPQEKIVIKTHYKKVTLLEYLLH